MTARGGQAHENKEKKQRTKKQKGKEDRRRGGDANASPICFV
jgi:hypothetical protein